MYLSTDCPGETSVGLVLANCGWDIARDGAELSGQEGSSGSVLRTRRFPRAQVAAMVFHDLGDLTGLDLTRADDHGRAVRLPEGRPPAGGAGLLAELHLRVRFAEIEPVLPRAARHLENPVTGATAKRVSTAAADASTSAARSRQNVGGRVLPSPTGSTRGPCRPRRPWRGLRSGRATPRTRLVQGLVMDPSPCRLPCRPIRGQQCRCPDWRPSPAAGRERSMMTYDGSLAWS